MPDGAGAIYRKIYKRLRMMILEGTWPPGTRIPSSRALARDLKVSRNTTLHALDRLTADGWIVARNRSGLFVSSEAPRLAGNAVGEIVPEGDAYQGSGKPICFELAQQDVELFPLHQWQMLQREMWSTVGVEALLLGDSAGTPILRQALARFVAISRGIRCSADQILVVPSTQAGIDLCARVLTRPGDRVWVEDPGYTGARQAFRANDLSIVPLPVDRQGLDIDAGMATARDARAAYVTPTVQFPTGYQLSDRRASALLAWAQDSQAWIIEDDWDWHANFNGSSRPSLYGMNPDGRVIYLQSLNRTVFPALRMAFLILPTDLVNRFVECRASTDGFTNVPNQLVLAEFMDGGYYSSHLRESREVYAQRRGVLAGRLASRLPDGFSVDLTRNGLHLIISCPEGFDDRAGAQEVRSRGLACVGVSDFSDCNKQQSGLMLGFAAFPAEELETAASNLCQMLADQVQRL